ncbi:flagellar biosynthesis protein FlhF [Peptococcaceae bacterium]|nr:flagellar biosynthesis protein FlhF [Peptococcaceae bacterium]
MIIKKYVVDEMQEAVRQIKDELGPEAIIVTTQRVRGKGIRGFFKRKLEVTAVLEKKEEAVSAAGVSVLEKKGLCANDLQIETDAVPLLNDPVQLKRSVFESTRGFTAGKAAIKAYKVSESKNDVVLKKEDGSVNKTTRFKPLLDEKVIESLERREKERLLTVLDQRNNKNLADVSKDFYKKWFKALIEADVDQEIARQLIEDLEKAIGKYSIVDENRVGDDIVRAALINRISKLLEPAYIDKDACDGTQCLVFIGPPGVGKTTTLAKLATRFKLLESKNVALVTVYTYRYGAADQLKIYGSTIGVPVDVVMTPAELRQSVERHADKDYILIDTVGRSSKNTGQVLELKGFLESIAGNKQIYLVMSATTKDRDLLRIVKDFQIANYTGCIFTKLDETETLGSMLNIVLRTGVPLRYCTDGQVIPDDIIEIKPRNLAEMILRGV